MGLISKIKLVDIKKTLIAIKEENQIPFAATHGTILSIIIGLSSVYLIFIFNIYVDLEQNAISEALRVNKIGANRAWGKISPFAYNYFQNWKDHYDKLGVDPDTQNEYMIFRLLRLLGSIDNKSEICKVSKNKNGSVKKQIESKKTHDWLSKYRKLHNLSDIEEVLCIMTIIRLSDPFQPKLDLKYGGVKIHVNIKFHNKSDVNSWLRDVSNRLSHLFFEIEAYDLKELLINLKWTEGRLFVKMSENLSKKYPFEEFGLQTDTKIKSLPDDFFYDIEEISGIFDSTLSYTQRLNKLAKKIPSKLTIIIGLFLSIITFYSAVLCPLTFSNVKPFFYVYVPFVFYTLYFGYILWVVVF